MPGIIDCKHEAKDYFDAEVQEACSFSIDPTDVPDFARYRDEEVRRVGSSLPPVVAQLAKLFPQSLESIHHSPGTRERSCATVRGLERALQEHRIFHA